MTTTEFIVKAALGVLAIILIAIGVVWFIGGTVGTRLHRWRPDDTDAEQRAGDFVLRNHPGGAYDDPMWAPLDVALIARGICTVHNPALLGSSDCNDDCPTAISKDVADAAMDALTDNVHYGTPMPERDDLAPAMDLGDLRALVRERQVTDRRQAETGQPERQVRYIITRPAIGWDDHEGTRGEWIRLECEFGLRHDNPGPDAQPVVDRIAWNGAVMGRIVWPWTDPNGEVDPDPRRTNLARLAAVHEQHLGIEPEHDDRIPDNPWDAMPPGFGRIVPVQRDGSES
jgi:hypothetical protein